MMLEYKVGARRRCSGSRAAVGTVTIAKEASSQGRPGSQQSKGSTG